LRARQEQWDSRVAGVHVVWSAERESPVERNVARKKGPTGRAVFPGGGASTSAAARLPGPDEGRKSGRLRKRPLKEKEDDEIWGDYAISPATAGRYAEKKTGGNFRAKFEC